MTNNLGYNITFYNTSCKTYFNLHICCLNSLKQINKFAKTKHLNMTEIVDNSNNVKVDLDYYNSIYENNKINECNVSLSLYKKLIDSADIIRLKLYN